MEKKTYITEEEQKKCRKVVDAFAELEDVDIVVVDVGRYGFVKLQYYTPPTGFENDFTFTDSREMFEDLWEEQQKELMGKKRLFAGLAGIETV